MRVSRFTVAVLVTASILAPGSAAAQQGNLIAIGADPSLIRAIDVPLAIEGTLAVDFRAGPDTGCPAPCALSGSATWTPARRGSLLVWEYRAGRQRELTASVLMFEDEGRTGTSVRVVRSAPGTLPSSCVDARREDFGLLNFSAARADAIVARLLGAPSGPGPSTDLLGSRCAGPADQDLAHLLPSFELGRDVLMRGGMTLDFSVPARTFAAPGMTGVVSSSVKMSLGRARVDSDPEAEERDTPSGFRTRRRRELTATYAIEQVTGGTVTTFAGAREPALCSGLDSCGSGGTIEITPRPRAGEAIFTATGSRRSSRRELAAALGLRRGRSPRGVDVLGFASWENDTGSVVTSARAADGPVCSERTGLGGSAVAFYFGRGVRAEYGEPGYWLRDPFSTRCAGPALFDAAAEEALAAGTLRRSDFRRRRVTVTLPRGSTFAAEGYEGSTRSTLSLVLRRTGVELGTTTDVVPTP